MNTKLRTFTQLVPALLLATTSGPLLAATFTVMSPGDPATPAAANCTNATSACTLRDALAAADAAPDADLVLFNVSEPIYLSRKLTAHHPVSLDGGGTTLIRVHQGYNIATQPDKYFEQEDIAVLQPTYQQPAAGQRYMLELYGSGSAVLNLTMDGSITQPPGGISVERVDFNSDGVTDYVLSTIDSDGEDVWLLTGGILGDLVATPPVDCLDGPPLGSMQISGNELRNMNDSAISLAFQFGTSVTDNVITGGAWPQPGFFGDGIFVYCSAAMDVTGNQVGGFRNGISLSFTTLATISENIATYNSTGIELEFASNLFGPNLVAGNESAYNSDQGLLLSSVAGTSVSGNEVHHNGTDPNQQGGVLVVNSGFNSIEGNESHHNSGFGFALDSSSANLVADNEAKLNGGVGIVLVNDAQFNTVMANESKQNGAGLVMVVTAQGAPAPSNNTIESNEMQSNLAIDVLDYDPVCNDTFADNTFGTAFAESGACIQ